MMSYEGVWGGFQGSDPPGAECGPGRGEAAFLEHLAKADVEEVDQPFFEKTRILVVASGPPTAPRRIYVAWRREPQRLWQLTGHVERFNEVVAADPPGGLEDGARALDYLMAADAWTAAPVLRALQISSIAEIPWWQSLDHEQQAQVEDVKRFFADKISPPRLRRAGSRYELRSWLLVSHALVERSLGASIQGELSRVDTVHRRSLPVSAARDFTAPTPGPKSAGPGRKSRDRARCG